jgi:hypothetical protein
MQEKNFTLSQPILPQFTMRWFFGLALVLAALLTVVYQSDNSKALGATIFLMLVSMMIFLAMTALTFLSAAGLGALKRLFFQEEAKVQSPFATDRLPPQIIPPHSQE